VRVLFKETAFTLSPSFSKPPLAETETERQTEREREKDLTLPPNVRGSPPPPHPLPPPLLEEETISEEELSDVVFVVEVDVATD
jgi:hypothetical protein